MEKRVVLATLISITILFAYNLYFYQGAEGPEVFAPEMAREETAPLIPEEPPLALANPPEAAREILVIPESELLIRTERLEVQLTPEGEIASWRLSEFKDDGSAVDLIRPASLVRPLETTLSDTILVPTGFQSLDKNIKEFIYQTPQPIKAGIKKRLSLDEETYLMRVELEISNPSTEELTLEDLGLGWRGQRTNLMSNGGFQEADQSYLGDGKIKRIPYKGIGIIEGMTTFLGLRPKREPRIEESSFEGEISWIAQQERYFLTAIIPEGPGQKRASFRKTRDGFLEMGIVIPRLTVPPLGRETLPFKIYVGPKDYDELKGIYPGAERLAGLNTLSLLTLRTLQFLYKFSRNYGLAIILLAIIIKIILYPLTHVSLNSMKAMQNLTPEMNNLKKKYRDDRERLNREMMALYKRHKVNPLGGCLPVLVQLPFLYAIFTTLRTAIDLRGAPFIFWVRDLSEKDPFFVLPILMGITMFIQQKMSTTDPQQARVMAFMPFIFTFMFMGFPSGLVLYWLFQNIFSIGQQYIVNKSK